MNSTTEYIFRSSIFTLLIAGPERVKRHKSKFGFVSILNVLCILYPKSITRGQNLKCFLFWILLYCYIELRSKFEKLCFRASPNLRQFSFKIFVIFYFLNRSKFEIELFLVYKNSMIHQNVVELSILKTTFI